MENAKESPEGFIQEHNCEAKILPLTVGMKYGWPCPQQDMKKSPSHTLRIHSPRSLGKGKNKERPLKYLFSAVVSTQTFLSTSNMDGPPPPILREVR